MENEMAQSLTLKNSQSTEKKQILVQFTGLVGLKNGRRVWILWRGSRCVCVWLAASWWT